MITTFYSYKGGVGRSMALSGTAEFLASAGFNVICVDFDLEAPGLESYFCRESATDGYLKLRHELSTNSNSPGLLDLIAEYQSCARRYADKQSEAYQSRSGKTLVDNLACEALKNLVPDNNSSKLSLSALLRDIRLTSPLRGGSLRLLHAGNREDHISYRVHLGELSWKEFYENFGGYYFIEWLRESLLSLADFVLVDSRTGETEVGGVCTHQLADAVIMMSARNMQNRQGVERVLLSLLRGNAKKEREGRELSIAVMSTRVDEYFTRFAESHETLDFERNINEIFRINEANRWLIRPLGRHSEPDTLVPYLPKYSISEENSARWYNINARQHDSPMDAVAKAHKDIAAALVYECSRRYRGKDSSLRARSIRTGSTSMSPVVGKSKANAREWNLLAPPLGDLQESRSSDLCHFFNRKKSKVLIYSAPEDEPWAALLNSGLGCSDFLVNTPIRNVCNIAGRERKVKETPEQIQLLSGTFSDQQSSLLSELQTWTEKVDDRKIIILISDAFWQWTREIDPLLWTTGNELDYLLGQGNIVACEIGTNSLIRSKFSSESFWIKWNQPSDIRSCCEQVLQRFQSETFAFDFKGPELSISPNLPPGITNTSGWSEDQISHRYLDVRRQLDWDNTTGSAKKWWTAFEEENKTKTALVLRLAEELLTRRATITEFFLAYVYSNTDNIQANLSYLDYTRIKKEEERKKKEAAAKVLAESKRTDEVSRTLENDEKP